MLNSVKKQSNEEDDMNTLDQQYFSNHGCYNNSSSAHSNDVNKEFDGVVFDILKVDPEDIAGQLTLIDLPLFKAITPDELISCKWISREKLIKAPHIVYFTRRFNQTTFWTQKEILNRKKIETRGRMITHFIRIAKRLNELHSYNSLMAIIVALKSAPIHRLKKTWMNHVSKKELSYFERISETILETSDNKQRLRDMHMNCRLPCIPFLGLFLTDLIHVDIAHPHNSFENPQRRNQMNNICRLISEYQQSDYKDSTLLTCSCNFDINKDKKKTFNNFADEQSYSSGANIYEDKLEDFCTICNCSCVLHHGNAYGGGIVKNDGTIYINEIQYVKNYLKSFLYIEELQKFKEEELYMESLELEPETNNIDSQVVTQYLTDDINKTSTTSALESFNSKNMKQFSINVENEITYKLQESNKTFSFKELENNTNNSESNTNQTPKETVLQEAERIVEKNDDVQKDSLVLKHHPLDDSIVDSNFLKKNDCHRQTKKSKYLNINFSKKQQKLILNSLSLNDSPSFRKEILTNYFNQNIIHDKATASSKLSIIKDKFNCYASKNTIDESNDDAKNPIQSKDKKKKLFNSRINTEEHIYEEKIGPCLDFSIDEPFMLVETCLKRKCIMKNFQKPTFNQWKSYWVQLFAGNLLIYYKCKKTLLFTTNNEICNQKRDNNNCKIPCNTNLTNTTPSKDRIQSQIPPAQICLNPTSLENDLQDKIPAENNNNRKHLFNNTPSKIHQISNWMVVNLFDDLDKQLEDRFYMNNKDFKKHLNKYDIQLNDLNSGNMYKYRFDNIVTAKEWFEYFKLASTFNERKKLENLIKFD